MKVKVAQSCPTLCDPTDYGPWNSLGQNTGVGSLSLLQEIFPAQGSNPGLPHCRQILYQLSHREAQCTINVLYPNHPKAIPSPQSMENPSTTKWSLVPKTFGTFALVVFFPKNKMGMGLENIASQCQSTSESPREYVKSQIARPFAP